MESLLLEVSTREHEDFVSELQVRLETLERNMADASAMQGCVAAESEELRKEVQRQRDSSSASAARIANLESELLSALSQLERCNVMIPKIMDRMRNKPQEIRVVPRSKTARASSPAPGKAGNPSAPSCHPSVLSNEALLAALEQEVANAGQLELDISERSQRTVAGDLMKAMFGGAKHAK
ncbi:hypothetical protein DFJ74DRAFT_684213 [Hyaloraphidium curvatum]|nr:hypothetical protein DFJ74DRAFT_684213 [Hyaloraphidium curvatum]